jgi:hypothetical protein
MKLILVFALAPFCIAAAESSPLDEGYRQMYNLQFAEAHQSFQSWEKLHPDDPMGPASDAAAFLFAEFDRLQILEAEFFTDDDAFRARRKLTPDANVHTSFDQALNQSRQLATSALAKSAGDQNALFANILRLGLHADYLALIEHRYADSLSEMKSGRLLAQQLVSTNPAFYDAYLPIGVENYLLSEKIAPLRWILRMKGAQTDKTEGLKNLRVTAEKGRYLLPFARLLLAVAALRDGDRASAASILQDLAHQFPKNRLYLRELSKISPSTPTHS